MLNHKVSKLVVGNGVEGLLIHIPNADVMTLEINFRAGSYLVAESKWETPHVVEHLVLGANKQYPNTKLFQAAMEKNGAYSNASTTIYDISYEAECADIEWDRIFELLLIAVTEPLFLRNEFEAELGNVREELTGDTYDLFRHLSLSLRTKFGLVGMTDQKRLKLMKNVKLRDVKDHYRATHTAQNMRLIIAGNLTPDRQETITAKLKNMTLPAGTGRLVLPNERPVGLDKPLLLHNRFVKNVYFHIDSFMSRQTSDDETDGLRLANTMLTEMLNAKILGTARERGLMYDMSSGIRQTSQSSDWWFDAQVSKHHALPVFDIIIEELLRLISGKISDSDFESAKAFALGRFLRDGQTVGAIADGYRSRYFFDGHIENYYHTPQRINKTTKAAMIEVARELTREKLWGLGVLGNCDKDFAGELYARLTPLWG